jgi:hypothetical protein
LTRCLGKKHRKELKMTRAKTPPKAGKLLILVILLFVGVPAFAQVDTAWVRRYNGPGNGYDEGEAIALDKFGSVFVTGYSCGVGTGKDYVTIKYYANGDTAWLRRYCGIAESEDEAAGIGIDGSGNVFVTGSEGGYLTTIKYLSDGTVAWISKYYGPGATGADPEDIAVDENGNSYITGVCVHWHGSQPDIDYLTMKYNPNGDTTWVRIYGTPESQIYHDIPSTIRVDPFRNVYVTGNSYLGGFPRWSTIKYYPNGDTAWVRKFYPVDGFGTANSLVTDNHSNVYVVGDGLDTFTGDSYFIVVQYDSNGVVNWGWCSSSQKGSAYAVEVDDSDNVYVTGTNYITTKFYPSGDTVWVRKYGADYFRAAYALTVDGDENVYVTGSSYALSSDNDIVTIKYVQSGNNVTNETPKSGFPIEHALFQNYPNPFNQMTKIEFTVPKSGFVSLNIYDILGRKVRTLVSEHLSSGYKSVLWDGRNNAGKEVSSGIYFYQLRTGDYSETKKLVLLK